MKSKTKPERPVAPPSPQPPCVTVETRESSDSEDEQIIVGLTFLALNTNFFFTNIPFCR